MAPMEQANRNAHNQVDLAGMSESAIDTTTSTPSRKAASAISRSKKRIRCICNLAA
jgi:hypothetical protein